MNPAAARTSAPPPMVFRDAFGERRRIAAPTGSETLDVLCLRTELTAVPSFEFALRERVSRLASFRHPHFAQVRTVERLGDPARTLALISNTTAGVRMSDLLTNAAKHDVLLTGNAALCLIRQLVGAMATLHEQAPDAAHGALGPERLIVSPTARLVIVEHVIGAAVEQLQFSEERYWRELRVPCPRAVGLPVFDQRADVLQIGMVALALLLRRPIQVDEFPSVQETVASARAMSATGEAEALPPGLRPWLNTALQLDPRATFRSAVDAREELEQVFALNDNIGDPASLESFLARYQERLEPASELVASPSTATMAPSPVHVAPLAPVHQPEPIAHQKMALDPEPVAAEPAYASPSLRPESIAVQTFAPEPAALEPLKPHRSVEPAFPSRFEPLPAPASRTVPVFEVQETTEMPPKVQNRGRNRMAIAAVLLLLLVGGGTLAARMFFAGGATTGTVVVATNPPGVQVLLDGQPHGVSPTTLTVAPGAHVLELRGSGEPRTIPIDVTAGGQLSQYIEMGKGATTLGNLQVRTDPPGAKINVDGVPIGPSPVTVLDLQPGEHSVVVETEAGSTRHTVVVEAGATASLLAQLPVAAPSGPVSGWISVNTPRTVQLFEDGRLLGSSDTERLMVPAGTHRLEIVNEALGYREARTVQVGAGKVTPIAIEFPMGTIALNALPWADVWIDGEKVGETPIGNLAVTIGSHEIIFRHPELGEQRHVTTVTLAGPARLSVDMRKRP